MKNKWLCLIIALILSFICGTSYASYDLGEPVPLDTRAVTPGSTGWFQSNPAIAGSGSNYLAVWVDTRDAGRGSDLYATRIAADGTVIDPLGIRLTTHTSVTGKPDVCWNGENFFVVFASNVGVVGSKIYAVRVLPDGTVLDNTPIAVSPHTQAADPQVTWDGTRHFIVWQGSGDGTADEGIWALYMDREGVCSEQMKLCGSSAVGSRPAAASSPNGYTLVVWDDDRNSSTSSTDIYGAVVHDGLITRPNFIICTILDSQDAPDCCWAGDNFKVVWADYNTYNPGILGKCLAEDGSDRMPGGWITVSPVTERQSDPQIAWDGTNCLVTWTRKGSASEQYQIYGGRIRPDNRTLDGSGVPICTADGQQIRSAVASLDDHFIVCWMDSRSDAGPTVPGFGFQVRGIRLSSTVVPVGAEFVLTQSAPQHTVSCSAYNGRQFLVCFDEWQNGQRNLYGELIDAYTGAPVTSEPFVISPLLTENPFPAAAWNGESFVVTWLGGTQISPGLVSTRKVLAIRISPAGGLSHPWPDVIYDAGAGLTTQPVYTGPAITSDGNRCLIAFRHGTSIYAAFMERHEPDPHVPHASAIGTSKSNAVHEGVAVCWTGQRYFIAWKQALYSGPGYTLGGIDYKTMNADGSGLSVLKKITDETYPDYFKLACNGENVLLAAYGPQIVTRRFTLDGALVGPTLPIPDSNGADCVNLAWNGSEYVLTWLVGLSDTTSAQSWQDDMQFARINSDNQLADAGPIAVTETQVSEVGGSMCAGPLGRVFLAYSGWEGAPYASVRAKGLYLDEWMNITSLGQIPGLYEGARVSMSGPVATALFADRFYVQESRSFGIGIKSALTPVPGDAVSFTGKLAKLNGETVIEASEAQTLSSSNPIPDPVGMAMRKLGGVGPNSAFSSIDGALGLYNVGLLVKVWGKVADTGEGFFYLDDGSGIVSGPGRNPVKVYGPIRLTIPQPPYVEVTGISGSEQDGDRIVPVIRMTGIRFFGEPPG